MKDEGLIAVPLRSRRQQRAQLAQKLQHLLPAAVLLVAGLQQLTAEPHGWGLLLAMLEIVVGLLILLSLAKTVHASRHLLNRRAQGEHAPHRAHPAIEWENMIAAAMVLAEGWEHRLHGGHHFPRPAILTAAVLIVTGFSHGGIMRWAQARRTLRVSDEGLYVPGRPFKARAIHAAWPDVRSIDIDQRWAVVTTHSRQVRKLDLSDLDNAAAVRHALQEAQLRLAAANTAE